MKLGHKGKGSLYDPGGSKGLEEALRKAPGGGFPPQKTKWCFKCKVDKPILGSSTKNGMFLCCECKPKPKEKP